MRLALAASLAFLAAAPTLAAPPPTPKTIAALVVANDRGAESSVVKFQTYIGEALEAYPGLHVKKSEELFGMPVDDETQTVFSRAEKSFEEGRQAFEARKFQDAERKLRTTLKEYERSVVMLRTCGHYCDALAMYAASLHARGDSEEAKLILLDLLGLAPTYDLNAKKFSKEFIRFRVDVATSQPASLRGSVVVRSKPLGARIFVDGELRGYAPASIGPLPMGKHLLQLEHPGYRQRGEIVEISPEELEVAAELVPTPIFKKYDAGRAALAQEVFKPTAGPAITTAAKTLSLDRVVVATLKELKNDAGTELVMGFFDIRSGRRLSEKKMIIQGEEYGQVRNEIGRGVTALVNAVDLARDRPKQVADPLDGKAGTEEWSGEDRGGKNTAAERSASKRDPLDNVSGTEDW